MHIRSGLQMAAFFSTIALILHLFFMKLLGGAAYHFLGLGIRSLLER